MSSRLSSLATAARVAIGVVAAAIAFFAAFSMARGDGEPRYGAPVEVASSGDAP